MSEQNKDTARASFYMQPRHNAARSEIEGRPIYEEVEMVSIRVPGDAKTDFHDLVWRKGKEGPVPNGSTYTPDNPNYLPPYIERFAKQYEAFKAGQAQALTGTPLEHWPYLNTARVAELKAQKILTVEELSTVPDGFLTKLGMNARVEREKARLFIRQAADSSVLEKVLAEKAELEQRFAAEKAESDARFARLEALMAGQAAPAAAPEAATETAEVSIEDATDAQLKAFIKDKTGAPVLGNPSRATLEDKVRALAETKEAA